MSHNLTKKCSWFLVVLLCLTTIKTALAERILDVARLQTDVPNELIGMGLVVGLKGTGDGGDYRPAMRQLNKLLEHFGNPGLTEADLKNSNDVAIVHLSMKIPPVGARSNESFDVQVSAVGAAKSLRGGQLVVGPMYAPRSDIKLIYGKASGSLTLDDETIPTRATIRLGGTLTDDILPEEIQNGKFTLVLHPNTANMETATAVAARINEEVSAQTDGLPVAIAVDATSIDVTIPQVERSNTTAFISRIRSLPLPNIPLPATVTINEHSKTIAFSDQVEIAPTTVSQNNMAVTIGPDLSTPSADPNIPRPTMASMKDLVNAFDLLKVSSDDRIAIVTLLHQSNALKADLIIEP